MLLLCFDFTSFLSCCHGVYVCVSHTHNVRNNSITEHSKINVVELAE